MWQHITKKMFLNISFFFFKLVLLIFRDAVNVGLFPKTWLFCWLQCELYHVIARDVEYRKDVYKPIAADSYSTSSVFSQRPSSHTESVCSLLLCEPEILNLAFLSESKLQRGDGRMTFWVTSPRSICGGIFASCLEIEYIPTVYEALVSSTDQQPAVVRHVCHSCWEKST